MHSATRRLSSRFFIGGPSLSLGRKWSSGKNGCSYFLKYTPRGILSPFFKKIEKKKTNCKTVRFRVIVEDGTPRIAYQKMSLTLPLRRD